MWFARLVRENVQRLVVIVAEFERAPDLAFRALRLGGLVRFRHYVGEWNGDWQTRDARYSAGCLCRTRRRTSQR